MENRDRDNKSKSTGTTPAGDMNRQTSKDQNKEKGGSSDFGKNIGQSEKQSEKQNEPDRQTGTTGKDGMKSTPSRSDESPDVASRNESESGTNSPRNAAPRNYTEH